MTPASVQDEPMLHVVAGDASLSLPIAAVAEIARVPRCTPVPGGRPGLVGVANVRGSLLPVVCLASLLGHPRPAATARARLVVLAGAAPAGLLVEAVATLDAPSGSASVDILALLQRQILARSDPATSLPAPVQAGSRPAAAAATLRLLSVRVGGQDHAFRLDGVTAILRWPGTLAPYPDAASAMLGFMPFRGGRLPVFSLAALLGLAGGEAAPGGRIVALEIAGTPIGLAADAVTGIVTIAPSAIDSAPACLPGGGAAMLAGICRLPGGKVAGLLDPANLLDSHTLRQLGGSRESAAVPAAPAQAGTAPVLVFGLGGERYGVPLEAVGEVLRLPDSLARVPNAPGRGGRRDAAARPYRPGARSRAAPAPDGGKAAGDCPGLRRAAGGPGRRCCRRRTAPARGRWGGGPQRGRARRPGAASAGTARRADPGDRRWRRMIRVLVVDDSALMRRVLGGILREADGMEVALARDGEEAIAQLHAFRPAVITLDVAMPDMDGLACLDRIMVERPSRVVMVSSLTTGSADVTLAALQLGAVDFIAKPDGAISLSLESFGPELVARVRQAARARLPPAARLAERVRHQGRAAATVPILQQAQPMAKRTPASGPARRLVLVGTSTGGPPALDALLRPLPADFPWPIVVAQHMPASFTGPLANRLDKLCALHVTEVTRPLTLAAGTVYLAQGDADILISARAGGPVAMPAPADAAYRWHPSVDRLVSSAMESLEASDLVGVLMTGMGNDGAAAMARLHAGGGRTIAEAEATAVVWGMPGELVRAGGAGLVARLEDIAGHLLAWSA